VRSRVAQLAVAYSVLYLPIFYAIHEDMLSTQLIPFVLAAFVLGPPIVALLLAIRAPRRLVPVRSRQATA
jgi:hypothetical protein